MTKRNYEQYRFDVTDWLEYIIRVSGMTGVIGYLFYDSAKAIVLAIPIGLWQYSSLKRYKTKEQKQRIAMQFRSLMEGLVTSLTAGYSLEHAFFEVKKDMSFIYVEETEIMEELEWILSGIDRNVPIEELLKDFGERSGSEDIHCFSQIGCNQLDRL